uniref:CRTAC1 family protein n=1 Tax=Stieleria sp. TaxID=2795976 RepID=UPI003568C72D
GDAESGLMIYQSGAGGAGVVDFDLDGWPDTYLTVMDGTPRREDSGPNRLYRNLAGEYSDVTDFSALLDRGFSQGVAVGDYNADGWPDVLVANIGENRLYQNNGDGTFRDVTASCRLSGSGWTTSVAIADLNADGHADLYEVGYCRGEEPLQLPCVVESIGEARSCNPMAFDAEPDRIWVGNGDGTFDDATDWFGPHEPGRGFALVIGDFDRRPGLETYVANDMTANHYWAKSDQTPASGLSDQAAVRGLALNRRSVAQASMGIAAADADNDGDIDFLLTHFVDDHNTFYRQDSPGVWTDASQAAGFVDSSKPMLAYGTQWIDVDNDGMLEVFIANGDIDDFEFEGRSFRQLPQLLQQVTRGRWSERQADSLGDYFTRPRLARSVATLDADRDGRTDLIVTHLFDPVALLINRSETSAEQTRFFLRATATHRDAIGARVRFTANDRTIEQSLLAGNGFQCANEACIVVAVPDVETLEDVNVTWPDGSDESLGDLTGGRDYLISQHLGVWPL